MRISNQVATLEIAKAEFEASWKQLDGNDPGQERRSRPQGAADQTVLHLPAAAKAE